MNSDAPLVEPTVAQTRVLGIQSKLNKWAQEDQGRRFKDLHNLVCDPATLQVAWLRVRANRGSRSAGVDGDSAYYVEHRLGVQQLLAGLHEELRSGSYRPLPVRERMIPKHGGKAFLKAGIMTEHGDLEAQMTGTPQGGILSPLMANIALTTLDEYFARAWEQMGDQRQRAKRRRHGQPNYRITRYADDFVICVHGERWQAEALIAETEQIIAPLGLALSAEKTRVVHIDDGIDFLGWRIQRHQGSNGRRYVYTYPSKESRLYESVGCVGLMV